MAEATPQKNVVTLSASVTKDVVQDMITVTFSTIEIGKDPESIKIALNTRLAEALTLARARVVEDELEVSTGRFSINPTYGKKSEITGYQGTATMIVSGTDTAAISQLAGEIDSMRVENTEFGISRKLRESLEGELGHEAIIAFSNRAYDYAQSFDFKNYTLINAQVNVSSGAHRGARAYSMAMTVGAASAEAGGGMFVEPGKDTVSASVSGTIQLK